MERIWTPLKRRRELKCHYLFFSDRLDTTRVGLVTRLDASSKNFLEKLGRIRVDVGRAGDVVAIVWDSRSGKAEWWIL